VEYVGVGGGKLLFPVVEGKVVRLARPVRKSANSRISSSVL